MAQNSRLGVRLGFPLGSFAPSGNFFVTVSDTLSLSDSIANQFVSFSDTLSFSDSISRFAVVAFPLSDSLVLTDTPLVDKYLWNASITIDHTKCGSQDSTNFPFLFGGQFPDLRTVANGGKIYSANGYDLYFSSDSAGQFPLDFDIDTWEGPSGKINAWVRIPILSHLFDTTIYVFYSNPSVTTQQSNPVTMWLNCGYQAVYHGGDGTNLSLADSTGNATAQVNHSATAAFGKIGGGFQTVSGQYVDTGDKCPSLFNGSNNYLTISYWVLNPSADDGAFSDQVHGMNGTNGSLCRLECGSEQTGGNRQVAGLMLATDVNYTTSLYVLQAFLTGMASQLTHILITVDLTDYSNSFSYVNGSGSNNQFRLSSGTYGNVLRTLADNLAIARYGSAGLVDGAILDEIRYSNQWRSASWDLAEYNNQSSPGTFFSTTIGTVPPGVNTSQFLLHISAIDEHVAVSVSQMVVNTMVTQKPPVITSQYILLAAILQPAGWQVKEI